MGNNYVKKEPLMPIISKSQFDAVATEFLTEYCPEALLRPMAVPIINIAKEKMGLEIIEKYRLSEDFSIYGQICFTSGLIPVYDRGEDEFRDIEVRCGTILIDPDTLLERNIGCLHNTVAHECVHWYKHRNYHLYGSGSENQKAVAYRYPVIKKDEGFQAEWDAVDWMEWQANGIAPRILMPIQTFQTSVEQILRELGNGSVPQWYVVNRIAELYEVSKQSAEIRMNELGIII